MTLYLVRHGEAVERTDGIDDEVRWLTAKGRKGMTKAAGRLRKRRVRPDLLISSPLTRAVQTAELLAADVARRGDLRADAALSPGGNVEQVLALIRGQNRIDALMLVGHEPLLSRVAAELLGRPRVNALAKGSCLALELSAKSGKPARVLWYAVPGSKFSPTAKKLLDPAPAAA
ncbi:phosphohistidine phosphatase SixA [Trichlorobacter ammonificans]|uniref:Phosphohistidine phosphatase, SixA n=1 Tax=Trichlorobacter ammonificans TaxID=2916410 RepID=A0ABN8HHM8_9BACT|nr:phosphohistidine phosphatase SixA [Trichlorobacter ammonificans]CAH2032283.1 Phosphohistidine phosphatase, SixA [Trichlorobacter ammonificans]